MEWYKTLEQSAFLKLKSNGVTTHKTQRGAFELVTMAIITFLTFS